MGNEQLEVYQKGDLGSIWFRFFITAFLEQSSLLETQEYD